MKVTKEQFIWLFVILAIVLLVGLYAWTVVTKDKQSAIKASPAMQSLSVVSGAAPYTDLDGNNVVLSDFVGQVLIVNSWASWSPASVKELSELAQIAEQFDGRVKVLAINRSEPASTAKLFLKKYDISDKVMLVLDPDDVYYTSIGGYSMPETIIYDENGNIYYHEHGAISSTKLNQTIQGVLYEAI